MKKLFIISIVAAMAIVASADKVMQVFKNGTLVQSYPMTADDSFVVEVNDTDDGSGSGGDSGDTGDSYTESGLYLGIIGFNEQLYHYPITLLNSETKSGFDNFINAMTPKNGTLLYYSVDEAINTLQKTGFPDDLHKVAIVTLTDGLDRGSHMMNPSYGTNEKYSSAINSRIKNEKVSDIDITAYSIGVRGSDVTDYTQFRSNLQMLASSDDKAVEVTNMSQVNEQFQEIAKELREESYPHTITIKAPGEGNGTKYRFTFDNVTNANMSQLYIEGDFNLTNKSLENIKYCGMNSKTNIPGSTIYGSVDGISVNFTFYDVCANNGSLISNNFTKIWTYFPSSGTWSRSSELTDDSNFIIAVTERSAAIMLVLDNSSSLGSDFSTMQSNAKSFISTLLKSIDSEDTPNPDQPSNPTSIAGEYYIYINDTYLNNGTGSYETTATITQDGSNITISCEAFLNNIEATYDASTGELLFQNGESFEVPIQGGVAYSRFEPFTGKIVDTNGDGKPEIIAEEYVATYADGVITFPEGCGALFSAYSDSRCKEWIGWFQVFDVEYISSESRYITYNDATWTENIIYQQFGQDIPNTNATPVAVLYDTEEKAYTIQNPFADLYSLLEFSGTSPDLTIHASDPTNCVVDFTNTGVGYTDETTGTRVLYLVVSESALALADNTEVAPELMITCVEDENTITITFPVKSMVLNEYGQSAEIDNYYFASPYESKLVIDKRNIGVSSTKTNTTNTLAKTNRQGLKTINHTINSDIVRQGNKVTKQLIYQHPKPESLKATPTKF